MVILDGKKIASKVLDELAKKVSSLEKKPTLAVILANDNPASKIYVNSKEKTLKSAGLGCVVYRFDNTVKQIELVELIKKLNDNPDITAILVQLPLFNHLDKDELIELIDPIKDADGFHPINVGKLNCGLKPYAIACTPKGIITLLKEYNIELVGKKALVIGRSNIVGKPMATLLLKENATVTIAHSKTKNLNEIAKGADIIVSAAGYENLVKEDMVKEGAIVIDVGIIKNKEGKVTGDVDFREVSKKVSYITPVPGGVGPMTIASLATNVYELYLAQKG